MWWRGRLQLTAPRCEIFDALGFAKLERRSPTLDGAAPLRVVQGCTPLLEGNAIGYQVVLPRIELTRKHRRWRVDTMPADTARMFAASLPLLRADGIVLATLWTERLARGLVDVSDGISIATGLFVRPNPGWRVRLGSTANRRAWSYGVREAIYDDSSVALPVILDIVARDHRDHLVIEGEVATLIALPGDTTFDIVELDRGSEIARRHLEFYDPAYFATKRGGEPVRKYRDRVNASERDSQPSPPSPAITVVESGPRTVTTSCAGRIARAEGWVRGNVADRLVFRSPVELTGEFDGMTMAVVPDLEQLATYRTQVEAVWQRWLATEGLASQGGAIWYLSKFITPHPPGEPHFFVKPSALLATPPGIAILVDGIPGDNYDILRGVIRTEWFHAVPAVFAVRGAIRVPRGGVLTEMLALPLEDDSVEVVPIGIRAKWP